MNTLKETERIQLANLNPFISSNTHTRTPIQNHPIILSGFFSIKDNEHTGTWLKSNHRLFAFEKENNKMIEFPFQCEHRIIDEKEKPKKEKQKKNSPTKQITIGYARAHTHLEFNGTNGKRSKFLFPTSWWTIQKKERKENSFNQKTGIYTWWEKEKNNKKK